MTIETRETNKVGHVKLFTNEIEALNKHEMNEFGFVTPIFVVKSELTQIGPFKSMVCFHIEVPGLEHMVGSLIHSNKPMVVLKKLYSLSRYHSSGNTASAS